MRTIIINNPGPQGAVGPQGTVGPSGSTQPFTNISGSIWATTSSLQVTGSFIVSGSSTFTNIGPAVFSGSVNATSGVTMSSAVVSGNVTVLGTASINVLQINTTINSTGSNQLGDAPNDTQTLYGTVRIVTGSLAVSGSVSFGTSSAGLFWDNTNNRLGIGIATPAGKLDLYDSTTSLLYVRTGTVGANWQSAGVVSQLGTYTNHSFVLKTNDAERVRIVNNGNVLIGTTTDSGYKLDVSGSGNFSNNLTVTGSLTTTGNIQANGFYTNAANGIGFFSPATAIRITTNDNGANIIANNTPFFSFANQGTAITRTSGTGKWFELASFVSFAPTSGTTTMDWLSIAPTINQTGGANGITRGIYVNPTLTAAADWRAIETTSGSVIFNHGATPLMFISSSGKVGIGTNTFVGSIKLTVNGTIGGPTFSSTYLDLTGGTPELRGNSGIGFYSAIGDHIFYGASSVERMRISSSGNVGIGTSTPTYNLDVVGNVRLTNAASQLIINNATYSELNYGSTNYFRANGAAAVINGPIIQFLTGGTERARIDANGSVSIGTASAAYKLDVLDNAATYVAQFRGSNSSYIIAGDTSLAGESGINARNSTGAMFLAVSASVVALSGTGGANTIAFRHGGSERMRIDSSGNVGIGTTSPSYTLDVSGSAGSTARFKGSAGQTTVSFNDGTTDNYIVALSGRFQLRPSGNTTFTALGTGEIGIGTTTPTYKLDVYGTYHQSQSQGEIARYDIANANADQNRGVWNFYTNTSATADFFGRFGFKFEGGVTDAYKQFQVHIGDSTTPKFVVDGSGRMGIGTITPSAKLHISGSTSEALLIASSSAGPALYVSGSGNVGIGTSTPNYGLEIANTGLYYAGASQAAQLLITTSGSVNKEGSFISSYGIGDRTLQLGISDNSVVPVGIDMLETNNTFGSTYLNFRVNNANLVRMTGSFVGIGTLTPSYSLDVSGSTFSRKLIVGTDNTYTGAITGSDFYVKGTSGGTVFTVRDANNNTLFGAGGASGTGQFYVSAYNIGLGTATLTSANKVHILSNGATSATTALLIQNSTPTNLLSVLDNGQVSFTSPTMSLAASQSAFSISPIISASNIVGGQYYGVNITPTFFQTTGSQTETAFRVAATYNQSSAVATSGTNVIADFGSTSAGSQLTVTDVTSGSIYMVNDVSGIPIIEATSNWDVNIYDFPNKVFEKTGSQVNIYGTMRISGSFILPLSQSVAPQTGSAYWSGSLLFIYNGTRYMSASFA